LIILSVGPNAPATALDICSVMAIRFHTEDVKFTWKHKRILFSWVNDATQSENHLLGDVNVILCSDQYLLNMNKQFLEHDYYTDIITFDYTEGNAISGDLYISLDRVKDNALKNIVSTNNELYRVVIHGIMHLCGYKDKSKHDSELMRQKEDLYLSKLLKNWNVM
jgi:probable rRNA maturation factor